MKLFDCSFPSPAANLAADEVLLDLCEDQGVEVLRFWESAVPFVVAGYGNKIATEVNVAACEQRSVPVLRRCSGGGTIVQGPGCLNYAVTLRVNENPELATVTGTNQFVMERNRAAMEALLGEKVSIEGHSDLVVHDCSRLMKFSGNAQRRRRESILFHGTLLYAFELKLISEVLRPPSKQPDYRSSREHSAFITNVPATGNDLKTHLSKAWNVHGIFDPPLAEIERLASGRYSAHEWNQDRNQDR